MKKWILLFSFFVNSGVLLYGQPETRFLISIAEDKQDQALPISDNGKNEIFFRSRKVQSIFDGQKNVRFKRAYPGIEKYPHPNAKILARYYYVEGDFDKKELQAKMIKNAADLYETVEVIKNEKIILDVPNDYGEIPGFEPLDHAVLDNINATQAWDITKGDPSIRIAIDDPQGFYLDHPDYIKSNGISKVVYVDPSSNDEYWIGVIHDTSNGHVGYGPASHGLKVATIAAGATDNGEGVSSIGYNCSLMLFDSWPGDWYDLSYNHGADVIVASYIHSCSPITSVQLEIDMVHANGTVMVAAAGNGTKSPTGNCGGNEKNGLVYPASYNHVISVGGVTKDDFYFFNNTQHATFNSKVDITAPAEEVPAAARRFSTNMTDVFLPNWNGYKPFNGTSAAAPIVGGIAGLILSLNHNISALQVENIMKHTAVNLDGKVNPNYPDNSTFAGLAGEGRVDAFEAVKLAQRCFTDQALVTSYFPQDFGNNPPKIVTQRRIVVDGVVLQSLSNYEFYVDRSITFEPGFKAPLGTTLKVDICENCKSLSSE